MPTEEPNRPRPGPEPKRVKVEGDWQAAVGKATRAGKPPQAAQKKAKPKAGKPRKKKAAE